MWSELIDQPNGLKACTLPRLPDDENGEEVRVHLKGRDVSLTAALDEDVKAFLHFVSELSLIVSHGQPIGRCGCGRNRRVTEELLAKTKQALNRSSEKRG